MKQAYVNGEPIPREAIQFELDRLVKFYVSHGMSHEEIKKNLPLIPEIQYIIDFVQSSKRGIIR